MINNQSGKTRSQKAAFFLLFWCLFIGFGAVLGAVCMLIKPDGSILQMQAMLPYFQVLPFSEYLFQNYIFSGISLLIVNGISNLTAASLLLLRKKCGKLLGMLFGITLMLWIIIQFCIFPANILSTSYFIFGFLQTVTGIACLIFSKQEQFVFRAEDYPNIDASSNTLVLYFSRMGYVKKIAYETANEQHAAIYEVKTTERTEGTSGFWWCGRFGIRRLLMNIEPLRIQPENYEQIIICTPIWVFHIAAPIRRLCQLLNGKVKKVSYVVVHFERFSFTSAADEMDRLLGVTHQNFRSVCCKIGNFKENPY